MENGEWRIENGELRMENGELFATLMIFALLGNLSKLNCSRASQKLRMENGEFPLLKSTIYQLHKQITQNNHNKTLLYQLFFVTLHRFL